MPVLWIKQRSPNVNAENLTFIISMVGSMFGYCPTYITNKSGAYQVPGGGGAVPHMGYIGMCRCEGYGFQAVYSRIGYINQSVWV